MNDLPTTSLAQLVPGEPLALERVAAVLACTFEGMWDEFVAARGSFEPFIELYLERWLHSCVMLALSFGRALKYSRHIHAEINLPPLQLFLPQPKFG